MGLVAVVLLVTAGTAGTVGAFDRPSTERVAVESDSTRLTIDIQPDGTARWEVVYRIRLDTQSDTGASEQLRRDIRNGSTPYTDRFGDRMARIANSSEAVIGREMAVGDATLDLRADGDAGIVTASVTWNGLAAVGGDRVTLAEPFASGFSSERTVHVYTPEGYAVAATSPAPDSQTAGHLRWDSGADLTGFDLVATAPADGAEATPTPAETGDRQPDSERESAGTTTDGSSPGGSGPGFGVLAALAVLGAIAALARRR